MPLSKTGKLQSWRVRAPARLHLGFVDLHGGMGRRFGGFGVTLRRPFTELLLQPADRLDIVGAESERVRSLVQRFDETCGVTSCARIEIVRAIPDHRGLGSGTQLALVVGHALSRLHQLQLSSREIAAHLGRGQRSGIGVAAFDNGGVVADGGRKEEDTLPPPVIARLPFPEEWRILLIRDEERGDGLHGRAEDAVFQKLPEFSSTCAGFLSRLVMMKLLPALAECDYDAFTEATGEFQAVVGSYFSSAQGGCYRSRRVAEILEYLHKQGVKGGGQSSWGPTVFVIARDQAQAETLRAFIEQMLKTDAAPGSSRVELFITEADNRGGAVEPLA